MTEYQKQFCPYGHDTFICGRSRSNNCLACHPLAAKKWRQKHKQEIALRERLKYESRTQEQKLKDKESQKIFRSHRKKKQQEYAAKRYSVNKAERALYDRAQLLTREFGITLIQYDYLLTLQDGKCAICLSSSTNNKRHKYMSVDHDHETGKVRGLLCSKCNLLLGNASDSIETLQQAVQYLTKYQKLP